MELVGKQVKHNIFGEGNIVNCDGSYVKINFSSGNKEFIFPDAFERYLKLTDKKTATIVDRLVQKRKQEYKEEKLRKKKLRAIEREEREKLLKRERLVKRLRSSKVHPSAQSVFWCEADEEDDIFNGWRVFTGEIKSGLKKGQPRRLARVNERSACLLTVRDPEMAERDRRIIGMFMVKKNFNGRLCEDGYILSHKDYRIRLSEKESEEMLFWNYYYNANSPKRMTWNTGRHRYFDNILMAQILRDIIDLKKDPKEQEEAEGFFEYFCQINEIEDEDLTKPSGALMRT